MTNSHAVLLGSLGGQATAKKYGKKFYSKNGKKGAKITNKLLTREHYQKMANAKWDKWRRKHNKNKGKNELSTDTA